MCRLSMARSATLLPPTTDRPRCTVLPPSCGSGPRESSISRCRRARLLPGFRIAPVACPLARSPVLKYVHSIRLCRDVNRVRRATFETCQAPPPDARVGACRDGFRNVVEGTVDHLLLGIHHVNETAPQEQWLWWDLAFLLWGAVMIATGWWLWRGSIASGGTVTGSFRRALNVHKSRPAASARLAASLALGVRGRGLSRPLPFHTGPGTL